MPLPGDAVKRDWNQSYTNDDDTAAKCKELTDDGWTVHSIVALKAVMEGPGEEQAIMIVAWRDEEPGKPFSAPARMP